MVRLSSGEKRLVLSMIRILQISWDKENPSDSLIEQSQESQGDLPAVAL